MTTTYEVESAPATWDPSPKVDAVSATLVVVPDSRHPGEYHVCVRPEGWATIWYSGRESLGPFGRWSSWPSDAASFLTPDAALAAAAATPQVTAA